MADDKPIKRDVRNHFLFEVATEVANRIGGIYSVLKSKALVTTAEYGDRYTLIGPLNRQSAAVEVEELVPSNPQLLETIQSMQERGIELVYGRWLIEGAPRVLLIDVGTGYKYLDEWKGDLWNTAGIPSPSADHETNEAIVFGYLVAWFLGEVRARPLGDIANFLVHCPRTTLCGGRPFPRMARRCGSASHQETTHGPDNHLHHPRNLTRPLPLRRFGRLLQQPPLL